MILLTLCVIDIFIDMKHQLCMIVAYELTLNIYNSSI